MTMMELLRTPEASCSAHEINRRVRQIERDRVELGGSRLTAEQSIGNGLVTQQGLPDSRQALNVATPAQMNGRVAYNSSISPTMTPEHTKPSIERPPVRSEKSRPAAGSLGWATDEAQLVTGSGRQTTPMPWLMSLLCRLGLHDGRWGFAAEGNCTQGRECERCGSVHVRTKHQLEWQYIRERNCGQVRTCMRCNATKGERNSHDWSESYVVERRAWQGDKAAHHCIRCGVVEQWTVNDGD